MHTQKVWLRLKLDIEHSKRGRIWTRSESSIRVDRSFAGESQIAWIIVDLHKTEAIVLCGIEKAPVAEVSCVEDEFAFDKTWDEVELLMHDVACAICHNVIDVIV